MEDRAREEQIDAEREEHWNEWLADSLALLDSLNPEPPYVDADPEGQRAQRGRRAGGSRR